MTEAPAIEWQALLESGEASSQAAIARREGISRARVTQVMGLLRLAPEIQERVLSLPDLVRRPAITERALRPMVGSSFAAAAGGGRPPTLARVGPTGKRNVRGGEWRGDRGRTPSMIRDD